MRLKQAKSDTKYFQNTTLTSLKIRRTIKDLALLYKVVHGLMSNRLL